MIALQQTTQQSDISTTLGHTINNNAGAGAASNSAAAATIAATSTSAAATAPTGTTNIKNHIKIMQISNGERNQLLLI